VRITKNAFVVIACGALLVAGCQAESRNPPNSISYAKDSAPSIVAGSTPSDAKNAKLLAAKEMLFQKLSGRLMEAMSQSGPAGAIRVCQVEAKAIASDVGKEANVSIGRTGVRLRNASNTPPAWAQKLVADKTETPVFVKLSNDHAAALLPIKLQAQCLMCHGPSEQLALDVKAELAKLYPQDHATGFCEGELRGWFWVESLDYRF
jgi:hypothetical protein